MEALLTSRFTWGELLSSALLAGAVYLLLRFAARLLETARISGYFGPQINRWIRKARLLYEPAALVFLASLFILINPVFHGLMALLVLLTGFNHIRNYLNGRIIRFTNAVSIGKSIQTANLQGTVFEVGNFGVQLKTNKGAHFVPYGLLLKDGFTLKSAEAGGGLYHLIIEPAGADQKANSPARFLELLRSAPYPDWAHPPELSSLDDSAGAFHVRILVREEGHLNDLMALIREWGYSCKISKK